MPAVLVAGPTVMQNLQFLPVTLWCCDHR